MSDWKPIETAPRDGSEVLIWDGATYWVARWNAAWKEWDTDDSGVVGATHWQPLPAPPDAKESPH